MSDDLQYAITCLMVDPDLTLVLEALLSRIRDLERSVDNLRDRTAAEDE